MVSTVPPDIDPYQQLSLVSTPVPPKVLREARASPVLHRCISGRPTREVKQLFWRPADWDCLSQDHGLGQDHSTNCWELCLFCRSFAYVIIHTAAQQEASFGFIKSCVTLKFYQELAIIDQLPYTRGNYGCRFVTLTNTKITWKAPSLLLLFYSQDESMHNK